MLIRTTRGVRLGICACAALIGCTPARDTESPAAPPATRPAAVAPGRLAFTRDNRLYLVNPDGTGERLLATSAADDKPFDFSPDGRLIAFTAAAAAEPGAPADLFVVSAEPVPASHAPRAERLTRLTAGVARSPAFSPDSKWVAFMSDKPVGLHLLPATAADPQTAPRRLTQDGQLEQIPTWAPDGRAIAYGELVFTDESAVNKFRMELQLAEFDPAAKDAALISKIATGDGPSDSPTFAPAPPPDARPGDRVLVYRGRRHGSEEITMVRLTRPASAEFDLTNTPAEDELDPRVAPGGNRIAFWRRSRLTQELCTIAPGGGPATVVCSMPAPSAFVPAPSAPEWSPDGRFLAWCTPGGDGAIYVVPAEANATPTRVTHASGNMVRWRN